MSYNIPEYTRESIDAYVKHRQPTGGFLTAVLSNNLVEAVGRADEHNINALPDIVRYVYNEIPANCWGSPEAVSTWLKGDGQ